MVVAVRAGGGTAPPNPYPAATGLRPPRRSPEHRADYLGDREAALGVQVLGAPGLLEPGADVRVIRLLVVRVEHRDQAHVGRALHVVLPAQRVQPAPWPADVPGDRAHRDQAAGVVGARRVLPDAHPPHDPPAPPPAPAPP